MSGKYEAGISWHSRRRKRVGAGCGGGGRVERPWYDVRIFFAQSLGWKVGMEGKACCFVFVSSFFYLSFSR